MHLSHRPGVSFVAMLVGGSIELNVDASAYDVGGEADRFRNAWYHVKHLPTAKIDVKVFDLGNPILRDAYLQPTAQGPARAKFAT